MSDKDMIIRGCEYWIKNHKGEQLILKYTAIEDLLAVLKEQEAVEIGHVDDVVEIKYFIKALETRLKYCPKQNVEIVISPESARRILKTLKRGTKQ